MHFFPLINILLSWRLSLLKVARVVACLQSRVKLFNILAPRKEIAFAHCSCFLKTIKHQWQYYSVFWFFDGNFYQNLARYSGPCNDLPWLQQCFWLWFSLMSATVDFVTKVWRECQICCLWKALQWCILNSVFLGKTLLNISKSLLHAISLDQHFCLICSFHLKASIF